MHARVSRGAQAPEKGAPRTAVVLVHGAVISGSYFAELAGLLSAEFDVYVPDLPGQGRSDKPARALRVPELADALLHYLDACDLARPVLVGHSLGCQTVAALAQGHPGRASALVLMAPTVAPRMRSAWGVLSRLAVDVLLQPKTLLLHQAADVIRTGVVRGWQTMHAALEDRIEERLDEIAQPALVLRGTRDLLVPRDWAAQVAARLPNATLTEVSRAPHAAHYSHAGAVHDLLRPFLLGLPATREPGRAPPGGARQARGGRPREGGTTGSP